ncbi:MAG TPA: cache domain-containing protein, partial [Ktedonobacteraceae bacterium]|nr:cache domain-containing protein [Ktedonobacteraceae bacterium]
ELREVDAAGQASLQAGVERDKNYITWSLFNSSGIRMLSYPQQPAAPQEIASQPEWFQTIKTSQTGQPEISPVYYDTTTHKAFVDIYSPIYQGGRPDGPFLGFLRVKLNLDYIWGIVRSDRGIGNSGSSFVLDQNGVRIADTYNQSLFTAVAPLSSSLQRQIATQNWYETKNSPIVQRNTLLADALKSPSPQNHLTMTPYGQTQTYQAALYKATIVPWTYFVISPSSVVTRVADQQLLTTIAGALVLLVLAALIGWLVSNRINRPIMHSVDQLRKNSEALNSLARKQQSASKEQSWVIDSVQVGLRSVQYYTDATRIAAHRLGEIGARLKRSGRQQNGETIKQSLQDVINVAHYIEEATHYQMDGSQKLITAIKVASQVNEQLTNGSTSATEGASQLRQVVDDLRNVVGS